MEAAKSGHLWRQYVFAGIVNIGIASTGYSMGWGSPVHTIFENVTASPLDHVLTTNQEAWMGSLLAIGAIFGPFIAGFAASTIGRKWGLLISAIPLLVGWILILVTSHVNMIYAGRILWGLGEGMVYTIGPMYCAEIATTATRGALGSLIQLFNSIGFLLVYSIGPYVSYEVIAYVGVSVVAAYILGMFFIPESPMYYLTKNDEKLATKCLAEIRGKSLDDVKSEINEMSLEIQIAMERNGAVADIFRGNNFKAFYISCAMMFFQQLSGIEAVLFYCSIIFETAGADVDPAVATIILGFVLVVASVVTPLVVDKLGRRFLLLVSTGGSAVSLGLLGTYFVLSDNGFPSVAHVDFLPVLALVLFIVTFSMGIGPLPWPLMSELLPIEVKTVSTPIVTALCWIMMFLITRFFYPFAESAGMGTTFLTFGGFCVCSFLFTLCFIPETKGKSFQEIQDILSGKSSSSEGTSNILMQNLKTSNNNNES